MTPWSALLLVAAACAVVDWWAVATGRRVVERVAKAATLATLVAVVAAAPDVAGGQRGWLLAALVLCLTGDVLLSLPRDLFVPGLAAFLIGHLAYVPAFWPRAESWPGAGVALVVACAVAVPVLPGVVAGARREGGRPLVVAVLAYVTAIVVMSAVAGASGSAWALAGGLLFVVSDAVLAHDRFVRARRHGHLAVMVTYHLAQGLLVLSFLT